MFPFLNPYLREYSHPQNLEKPHSNNYIEKCNPIIVNPNQMRPNTAEKPDKPLTMEYLSPAPLTCTPQEMILTESCQAQLPHNDMLKISKTFICLLDA